MLPGIRGRLLGPETDLSVLEPPINEGYMPTLKVRIDDPEAMASIHLSVIIDYLLERGWHSNKSPDNDQPERITLFTRTTEHSTQTLVLPFNRSVQDYPATVYQLIEALSNIEGRSQLEIFDDLRYMAPTPPGTYPPPWDGWVCFHCGIRFRSYEAALEHFGPTPDNNTAACLNQQKGQD